MTTLSGSQRKIQDTESMMWISCLSVRGYSLVAPMASNVWGSPGHFPSECQRACVAVDNSSKCSLLVWFRHWQLEAHHFPLHSWCHLGQGKCLVWHISNPPGVPVHQRIRASAGGVRRSCPNVSCFVGWHCTRPRGDRRELYERWGSSIKPSPAKKNTNEH